MGDETASLEEYRRAVVRIARLMPEFIDEMRRLRGAIDRMPRGRSYRALKAPIENV